MYHSLGKCAVHAREFLRNKACVELVEASGMRPVAPQTAASGPEAVFRRGLGQKAVSPEKSARRGCRSPRCSPLFKVPGGPLIG